jgi:hypothetical protein
LWVFVRDGNVVVYKFQRGAPGGEWSAWEPSRADCTPFFTAWAFAAIIDVAREENS